MKESDLEELIKVSLRVTMRYAIEFCLEHEKQFKQWVENKRKNEVKEK